MSETNHAAHGGHSIKPYLAVFAALMVLTVVTVAVSKLDLSRPMTLFVGISIAVVKASLVALFFMHLKGERLLIWGILGLTGVFAFILWVLPTVDQRDLVQLDRVERVVVVAGAHQSSGHGEATEPTHMSADEKKSPKRGEKLKPAKKHDTKGH